MSPWRDARGIALPLTLLVLTLVTSLTLAFLAVGATEPMIARNLERGEAALALAEAGIERAIWALANPAATGLTNLNQVPAAYRGQTLFPLGSAGYSVAVTGTGPVLITGRGYVVRNGVVVPAEPAQLARTDIAAQRAVQVQATSSGPVGGRAMDRSLPGALTVAGSLQTSGNTIVDGEQKSPGIPNDCPRTAGATIRDTTTLSDGTVVTNAISSQGAASFRGSPGQQTLAGSQLDPYLFTPAQLDALRALAQSQGTYLRPSSGAPFTLSVTNGLTFVDTVNGQSLGAPPDASKLASVTITSANNSGWLVVMGSLRIEGNVTFNGLVYAHDDLTYRGTGSGGIYGAVVSANAVRHLPTVLETDGSGHTNIYYDCVKAANGGGAFTSSVVEALERATVTVTAGSWREIAN